MTIHYVALSLVTLFAITSATGNSNVTNVEGDLSRSEHVEMDSGATLNVKEVTESHRRMAESTFISEHDVETVKPITINDFRDKSSTRQTSEQRQAALEVGHTATGSYAQMPSDVGLGQAYNQHHTGEYFYGPSMHQNKPSSSYNQYRSRDQQQTFYSQSSPDGRFGSGRSHHQNTRPTLANLDPQQSVQVNTPEELLEHCCQFPACYDPLYELCIDTCRKCETDYPVTSWLPCPPLLNIPDCTSDALSRPGRLPLACYPDIGPFANIVPVSTVSRAPSFYDEGLGAPASSPYQPQGRNEAGGSAYGRQLPQVTSELEQAYRRSMQERNKKSCSGRGLCHSEGNTRVFGTSKNGR